MAEKYFYRDSVTGKARYTRGRFTGWSEPSGLLQARYARFETPRGQVFVPVYALLAETRQKLPGPEQKCGVANCAPRRRMLASWAVGSVRSAIRARSWKRTTRRPIAGNIATTTMHYVSILLSRRSSSAQ